MQVNRFVLSFPEGSSEYSFSCDEQCPLTSVSFGRLFRKHQENSPYIPYLIAKVGAALESVQLFDGMAFYKHAGSVRIQSACYFAFAYSDEDAHHFHFAEKASLVCFDPKQILARANYVRECLETKKVEQAKKWLEACLQLSSTDDQEVGFVLAQIGNFLRFAKEWFEPDVPKAKQFLEKALEIDSNCVLGLLALGSVLGLGEGCVQQDCAMAKELFFRVLKIDSGNFYAAAMLGELYAVGGENLDVDHEAAKNYFKLAKRIEPDDGLVLARLADCMAQTDDDPVQIRQLFQRAYEAEPTNTFVLAAYGDFLRTCGDGRAKELLDQAFALDPDEPFTLECLEFLHKATSKVENETLPVDALRDMHLT